VEYQYHPQRLRYLPDGRQVGTINVGDILYIQQDARPFHAPSPVSCREPWQVEAWLPREAFTLDPATRRPKMTRCAGGHLALVRSLRDSRTTRLVADWILLASVDAGLTR
jgi:hypothetical protein